VTKETEARSLEPRSCIKLEEHRTFMRKEETNLQAAAASG
jgi:hypothetical protein